MCVGLEIVCHYAWKMPLLIAFGTTIINFYIVQVVLLSVASSGAPHYFKSCRMRFAEMTVGLGNVLVCDTCLYCLLKGFEI